MELAAFVDLISRVGSIGILAFIVWEYRSGRIVSSKVVDEYIERYSEDINSYMKEHHRLVTEQVNRMCRAVEEVVITIKANGTTRRDSELARLIVEEFKLMKQEASK